MAYVERERVKARLGERLLANQERIEELERQLAAMDKKHQASYLPTNLPKAEKGSQDGS